MGALELLHQRADALRQSRELPSVHRQAGVGAEGLFGALEGMLGRTAANQGGHAWGVPVDEAQRIVQGKPAAPVGAAMVVVARHRDGAEEGMDSPRLAGNPALSRVGVIAGHTQARQGNQPLQHIAAHPLRCLAQAVFQPGDRAKILGLERLGRRVYESVQFLRPRVYRRMGFFLLSSGPVANTACSSNRAISDISD